MKSKFIYLAILISSILLGGCSTTMSHDGDNFSGITHTTKQSEKGVVVSSRKTQTTQTSAQDELMTSDIIDESHESAPQAGIEYLVKTENGSLISVTQGSSPVFTRGQSVRIQYGAHPHIVAN